MMKLVILLFMASNYLIDIIHVTYMNYYSTKFWNSAFEMFYMIKKPSLKSIKIC